MTGVMRPGLRRRRRRDGALTEHLLRSGTGGTIRSVGRVEDDHTVLAAGPNAARIAAVSTRSLAFVEVPWAQM